MQEGAFTRPATPEEWKPVLDQQNQWVIFFRDERWGSVRLVQGRIEVEGEKLHAIHNLLDSMRGKSDDTTLFRSLPYRLRGHVYAAFPEESPW